MGENFGHLARDLPVAKQLRIDGHEVIFAVKDVHVARAILGPENFRFVQSPRLSGGATNTQPATYAEVLLSHGYFSGPILSTLVKAWIEIFRETGPNVVIANHAPTAVLAARCCSLPTVATCIGFELPPENTNPASFRPHDTVPANRLIRSEASALGNINQVLESGGLAAIEHTSKIFSQASVIMTTFAELDHYGPRHDLQYVGLTSELRSSISSWMPSNGKKVFCYLRTTFNDLQTVLSALATSNCDALCVVPDATEAILAEYAGSKIRVQREPVNLKDAIRKADLVITYGTGTMHEALVTGRPILICAQNAEQFMVGVRVVSFGAGLILPVGAAVKSTSDIINLMIADEVYARSAKLFSRQHRHFRPERAISEVVRRVELLA